MDASRSMGYPRTRRMQISLTMSPAPGARLMRFVGDRVRFELRALHALPPGWRAFLRTDLGRGERLRAEIIASAGQPVAGGAAWRDVPMAADGAGGFAVELALCEVGFFHAKAFAVDARGHQQWPAGSDTGLAVHPSAYRSANAIYCAFPRMFGAAKHAADTRDALRDELTAMLDRRGFAVIPPSGTLRDLAREVPHIFARLHCRILHLLPITAVPTTYARFGRFGSPYACQDLVAIDPALVEFDRRTTAVDQFRELAHAVHVVRGRLFLDIVINHTGWGSRLMQEHPEWFLRNPDGTFHSPGAWGTTWEDLAELDPRHPALWATIADALIIWCERGVDGFRCDAGYMVPLPVWRYVVARVRQRFPETVFLLEGLGGAWEATRELLGEGGMQWAYSELFQNAAPRQVAGYLDHCLRAADETGVLVHYSETHDNLRLAASAPPGVPPARWSLLRNQLCALTSTAGGFGFTAGVEWLATERLQVHDARGMNWGAEPNLCAELGRLVRLISDHPCFFAGANVRRLSADDAAVLVLLRRSPESERACSCLVLINLDPLQAQTTRIDAALWQQLGEPSSDLLADPETGASPAALPAENGETSLTLAPGAAHCLVADSAPAAASGDAWRLARNQVAFAYHALACVLPPEAIGPYRGGWMALAARIARDASGFIAALAHLDAELAARDLTAALDAAEAADGLPHVVHWDRRDLTRIVPVPPGHWLLIRDAAPCDATLIADTAEHAAAGRLPVRLRSVTCGAGNADHLIAFPPQPAGMQRLRLERFAADGGVAESRVCFLANGVSGDVALPETRHAQRQALALLTNGRGGMSRWAADFGRVASKYDAALAANLHASAPVDRHVLLKRVRAYVNADGFLSALDGECLAGFAPGPPACFDFRAPAGDGRCVRLRLCVDLVPGANTLWLRVERRAGEPGDHELPGDRSVSVTLRCDVEDRSFHGETQLDTGLESWWRERTTLLHDRPGFAFAPAQDRWLLVGLIRGEGAYHAASEASHGIAHPHEAERGQTGHGDAWSPGWFELPLAEGGMALLAATAESALPSLEALRAAEAERTQRLASALANARADDGFAATLAIALDAFVVRRGSAPGEAADLRPGRTVIAGYPWFLDWGRDSFIVCRGLIAAGRCEDVRDILLTFARFADRGTLPNLLHGEDASNRDTSDAPLWFALAAEELAAGRGEAIWQTRVPGSEGTLADAVRSLAAGYLVGTPNGIRVDAASGLVWSPAHFTWMDTNHPACTPRQGYPIEIQALWLRLLRCGARLDWAALPTADDRTISFAELAAQVTTSLDCFWLGGDRAFADVLLAEPGQPAAAAQPDSALRPNQLFLVSLGLIHGARARQCVAACQRHLLIPGALRSLAPLPVAPPLVLRASDGRMLADPQFPYAGRYAGDEDTARKPAYHNGTGWVWLLPTFCEALVRAYDGAPAARAAARAYLSSLVPVLAQGCAGQLPELLDGDAPHRQRGCDAQAWSVSEALRVWRWLENGDG